MAAPQGYSSLGVIGFTDQGTYDNSATYYINDLVHYLGNIYRCKVDETSGIAPGENVNWTVFVGTPTNIVEELIAPVEVSPSANAYTAGRQFIYNDNLYEVVKSIAVGDALVNISDDPSGNIKDADRVETQVLQTRKMIAPIEESPSINAYSVGDQLIYNGLLYNVTAAIAIGDALTVGTNISLSDAVVDQIKAINTTLGNTDISGVGNSVTAAISSLNNDLANISNPNLLDNPFFSINQRGQTSYALESNSKIYTLDRWYIYDSGTIVTVNNDGSIKLETQTGGFKIFAQVLDLSLYRSLLGKNVTATINVSEKLANSRFYIYIDGQLYGLTDLNVGYNKITVTVPNEINDYMQFLVQLADHEATNVYAVIKSVKLELGTVSTLEMDAAPNYTTELLKCQRYYHIYATQSLRPSNMYDCIPQMKNTPTQSTITIDGTTYYANSADL